MALTAGLQTIAGLQSRGRSGSHTNFFVLRRTVRFVVRVLLSSFQAAKFPDPLVSCPLGAALPSGWPGVGPGQGTRYLLAIQTGVKVPENFFAQESSASFRREIPRMMSARAQPTSRV